MVSGKGIKEKSGGGWRIEDQQEDPEPSHPDAQTTIPPLVALQTRDQDGYNLNKHS